MDSEWNNPDNWKFGIFYYNPKDSRLHVPKRVPAMGWTINFGNRKAFVFLLAIIALIILLTQFGL